jgi:hypothetical protein
MGAFGGAGRNDASPPAHFAVCHYTRRMITVDGFHGIFRVVGRKGCYQQEHADVLGGTSPINADRIS